MKNTPKKSILSTRKVIIIVTAAIVLGAILRFAYLEYQYYRVTHGEFVQETDTFLGYTLMKGDKMFIVRCEKGVKERLADYHTYNKRVSIISNILSSKDDLPSEEEAKEFNNLELRVVDAVITNNEKDFALGGYVIGGGKKEMFLYANDMTQLNEVFKNLQTEFSTHTLKLDVQDDANWNYYNAYCENRQFPS